MDVDSLPTSRRRGETTRFFWSSYNRADTGRELLLIVGDQAGIVVARISAGPGQAWTLTFNVHCEPARQTALQTGSITTAIRIAEQWATDNLHRLERGR